MPGSNSRCGLLDRNDGRVDDDIRHGLRAETHLLHHAFEGAARKRVHGEGHALARLDAADIGLVDIGRDFHLAQIVGDAEQLRRLRRCGDGLAQFDIAQHDDAGHRRADFGILQIDLDLPRGGLALQDLRS